MTLPPAKPILYAEDNENDVMLMQMALRRAAPNTLLQTVNDGQDAISYLKGEGSFADRSRFPIPQVLLLDIKMPRMTGIEVLGWMRQQNEYKHLPVVMFTASLERKDQERCYNLGANSFLVKPNNIDELIIVSGLISQYWLQWNRSIHSDPLR